MQNRLPGLRMDLTTGFTATVYTKMKIANLNLSVKVIKTKKNFKTCTKLHKACFTVRYNKIDIYLWPEQDKNYIQFIAQNLLPRSNAR